MATNYVARQQTGWKVVSDSPDVCKTPMGAATPPVPYPVTAELIMTTGVAMTVRANDCPVVVYDQSVVPMTIGDSAGVALGTDSGTVMGKCYPKGKSTTVRAEKKLVVRHDDEFWMNGP
jgi:Domain of unknown function (DUF4150)